MTSNSTIHLKSNPTPITSAVESCPQCGVQINQSLRYCPTCQRDIGFPNVRAAATASEKDALSLRYQSAHKKATENGFSTEFNALVAATNSATHVVVAMPPLVARNLLNDPRNIYTNYENLVGGGMRTPAPAENDTARFAASGKLFGCYASQIHYGILSFDGIGLKNYGTVFVTLKDIAVKERVSFLHENSYFFIERHKSSMNNDLPKGFRANWQNRAELVAAKLEPMLKANTNIVDWASLLVRQGADRSQDSCIEAHIFNGFNADSINAIDFADSGNSREDKLDIQCIKEVFKMRKASGGMK